MSYAALFSAPNLIFNATFSADGLRIDVGRSDLYDDRTPDLGPSAYTGNFAIDQPRLPIGHFLLSFGAPLISGAARLQLWDAVLVLNVSTAAGGLSLRLWANAAWEAADVLVLETSGPASEGAAWAITWAPEPGVSTWAGKGYLPRPWMPSALSPLAP
jgi:hypothetical protein